MRTRKDLYEIGEIPPSGHVPRRMYANLIPKNASAEPAKGFRVEVVETPAELKADEVLVLVMAAGINYNNVWASLGVPLDMVKVQKQRGDPSEFHIGGSDGAGVVWAVGEAVSNVSVGDEVVLHCGVWDSSDPFIRAGGDPMLSSSSRIWGYETNWGSFGQFAKVQAHQCLPKPAHLTWEEAAAYMLCGATAYRMLLGWPPHTVRSRDVVLVWGGSGGLGCMAIQLVRELGGLPVAVVSNEARGEYCLALGAAGYIDRRQYSHWGRLPDWEEQGAMEGGVRGMRSFQKAIWEIVGGRRNPRIVFEHPGQDTIPTSAFVCESGGMIVICAGTTGYNADVDLRYLWMHQKRLQGSHFANDEECAAFNQLVIDGRLDPCLSRTFAFEEIGLAHQLMYENRHPNGNMAALVCSPQPGLKSLP